MFFDRKTHNTRVFVEERVEKCNISRKPSQLLVYSSQTHCVLRVVLAKWPRH